jgi:hypothetical protein
MEGNRCAEWWRNLFMLMFAVLARERGRLFRLLLLPFLFAFASIHSGAASAASLTVKIRQLDPAGNVQQVTCAPNAKCLLPVDIQTKQGKKETLTLHVLFIPGGAMFEFQTPDGYLYAWDKKPGKDALYETLWHIAAAANNPATYDVTLFLPAVPVAPEARILHVAQETAQKVSHAPVADLEITVEAAP